MKQTCSSSIRRQSLCYSALAVITVLCLLALAGCASDRRLDAYAPQAEYTRDPLTSQKRVQQAIKLLDDGPSDSKATIKVEELFREALALDLYNGQAHNNLGVLYLSQDKLYEAANEFEWARKLMPGHPDPRMNLALTLERAGRINDALDTYERALEVYPEHVQSMQAIARLQLRSQRADDRTSDYLRTIAMRGDTEHWRSWAQEQLVKQR